MLPCRAVSLAQIEYFVTVAEEGNIGRAARRLHISQPPLTRQIKNLEIELGAPLFERTRTGVRLLPKGEVFRRHAVDILEKVRAAQVVFSDQDRTDPDGVSRGGP